MSNEIYRSYDFELESNLLPVAIVLPAEQEAVVSSLVKLDGTASIDPEGSPLIYTWRFAQVPIGSQVERFGFTRLESDDSIVTFAPDVTGPYTIELVVSDGSLSSDPFLAHVDVRVILVPYHKGIVPDASFIWNYLSDFWNKVEGKQKFEVFWSSAIQIVSAEVLKLYQYDYNKSIKDIQELFQRRWLAFESSLVIDKAAVHFVLADDQAGFGASTFTFNSLTGVPNVQQPAYTGQIAVPVSEGKFAQTSYGTKVLPGRLLTLEKRSFVLSRAGEFTLSLGNDLDGGVTSGTNLFTGNGFKSSMVGGTLRILGNVIGISRDWRIASISSSTQLTVTDLNDLPVSFPSSAINLSYAILPDAPTHNVFVADTAEVPAGLDGQEWRFSSTLISSEHDYEAEGVSPGDLLELEITRLDLGLTSAFFVQVVSVSKNRLGFVLNLEDLVAGQGAGGFTPDIQVTLAVDLQVQGLRTAQNGDFVYSGESQTVNSTVRSPRFKRAYYEKELTPYDEIDVGAFSIQARPLRVIRNKCLPVDATLMSVPVLQEYVKQPTVIKDAGKIYVVRDNLRIEVPREPHVLAENLDYVIDDESEISGACEIVAGLDEIKIPFGDLYDRSIQEQDTLTVAIGYSEQSFEIRRVLSADTLRVYPTPNNDSIGATFRIHRRLKGKYLRFIDGKFTKKFPAPKRLWAEVSYFDNNDTVEDNFGVLVGLAREDLTKANSEAPYKSAVAGLMYSLANGPTISNLKLAGQILLGMPFTQAPGIVKEINPNYRLREDGSTRYGRLLVEGRDKSGRPTGLTYIYLYPQGRQIFNLTTGTWVSAVADFSGLATNPETGKEFAVGDSVDQFVPLSKGVSIEEYLITPEWSAQMIAQGDIVSFLRQYHSFKLTVNSDLVSASDIDLAAKFLQKAKAHYVRLLSSLLKSIEEIIEIEDRIVIGRQMRLFEMAGLQLPSALKVDAGDENLAFLSVEGIFYTRYAQGDDLITTWNSRTVVSPSGGFISPRAALTESWDPPLLHPGDVLYIESGDNAGKYVISEVTSDTELLLEEVDEENFVSKGGEEEDPQKQLFVVYRPLRNPVWAGRINVTTGDGLVATQESVGVQAGIGSSGVAVGDHLVYCTPSFQNPIVSKVYTVVQVVPETINPYVVVIPDPVEPSGPYDAWIVREDLMCDGGVHPYGAPASEFWVNTMISSPIVRFVDSGAHVNDWLNLALLRYGDTITLQGTTHLVMYYDPVSRRAWVTPPPRVDLSDEQAVVTLRPQRGTTSISVDFFDRVPGDCLELEVRPSEGVDTVDTLVGNPEVTSHSGLVNFSDDMNAGPGDYLVLREGPDSTRDIGHGLGIFMIGSVPVDGTSLRLLDNLSAAGNFRYGIRRKIPNEG